MEQMNFPGMKLPAQEKLSARFQTLDSKKNSLSRRCEDYASWTLPYIYPVSNIQDTEMQGPVDSIGARAVNHLANKLTMTLFAPYSPFFRLTVSDDLVKEFEQKASQGDEDAKVILDNLDKSLAEAEKAAMKAMDYNRYRTEATTVSKSLIITGNALLYHPEGDGRVQAYSLRDYCVVRDLSGAVIEIITRDKKSLYTFSAAIKEALRAADRSKYSDNKDVVLYTQIKLGDDGKFHLKQAADDILLDSTGAWPPEELPWIALTWNLVRGEDYGRGLVEDYAGAFHALNVLSNAMVDAIAVAADIKFLVNPASVIDVKQINDSPSGSYHQGTAEDITTLQLDKAMDLSLVTDAIDRFQRQIAQAFLLNSAMTRDAERVTAEEIRYVVQELELSHGGIYSRFAEEWQLRTAILMLKRVDLKIGKDKTIYPQIITGLDSLSRAGDLDNLRLFIQDLALLQAVPPALQQVIDPLKFAAFIGTRRGVDYEKFTKSQDQLVQEQQAMQKQQQQMIDHQAGAQMAVEAGKQSMKGNQ